MLEVDRDLGAALPAAARERARSAVVAPVRRLERGEWRPGREPPASGHLGFLVLDGLIARELAIARGRMLELLGPGDLLRPWEEEADSFDESCWRVLERAELAELDPATAATICEFPALMDSLLGRVVRRCRALAACATIRSIVGLEERLTALFWHFAESGGRSGPEGVVVPLQLTHRAIAEIAGARRPSVTAALRRLADDGRLVRCAEGWVLGGEPPGLSSDRAA